jgi:hypothetical protein
VTMLTHRTTCKFIKMTVFWVVGPCSVVEAYLCFRGANCLQYLGDHPDAGGSKCL